MEHETILRFQFDNCTNKLLLLFSLNKQEKEGLCASNSEPFCLCFLEINVYLEKVTWCI